MHQDYQPIENYSVIGDLRTIALVGISGSIDFMCFPDFDSPSIFTALLDHEKGGRFKIAPLQEDVKYKQMYLPDSNILLTRFLFHDGIGEITDFMPVAELFENSFLVRRVSCIKGEIVFRMHCGPRFNYARSKHKTRLIGNEIVFSSEGEDGIVLKLSSSIALELKNEDGYAEFTLRAGEKADFFLEYVRKNHSCSPNGCTEFVDRAFNATLKYWKDWSGKATYKGRWREMVMRSALLLKLLISHKHGSIIAAPTFGLPEFIGGGKNWDYRYTWIRDAAFTVYALMRLGYTEETDKFMKWVEEKLMLSIREKRGLDIMYSIDGRRELPEFDLVNMEGYMRSYPVRIGNAAHAQLQLDIYGELMDSVYLYDKFVMPVSYDTWNTLTHQINWVVDNWQVPDNGIWEIRGEKREFLYSRFMCWVALDRGIRLAAKRSFPMNPRWLEARDAIYNSVFRDFWNEGKKSFVHAKGGTEVDASTLLMPLVRFISPKDPRWLSTMACIERELITDSLVYRYKPEQAEEFGLQGGEGTFSLCSFWYTECLSRAGHLQKARYHFEKMLSYANHVGLYAEQLGFQGEHLGNFPQAFTHLALISAAFDLNRRLEDSRHLKIDPH